MVAAYVCRMSDSMQEQEDLRVSVSLEHLVDTVMCTNRECMLIWEKYI